MQALSAMYFVRKQENSKKKVLKEKTLIHSWEFKDDSEHDILQLFLMGHEYYFGSFLFE